MIFRILLEPSFPIAITEVDSDPNLLVLWNLPFYPLWASVLPGTYCLDNTVFTCRQAVSMILVTT